MSDERDRKPSRGEWPLSGPSREDPDEITGRFSALGDHPAQQAAFRRLAEQRERDRENWQGALAELAREMRKRDHDVRNEWAAELGKLHDEFKDYRHAVANARQGEALQFESLKVELTGRSGQNGKLGVLRADVNRANETAVANAQLLAELKGEVDTLEATVKGLDQGRNNQKAILVSLLIVLVGSLGGVFLFVWDVAGKRGAEQREAQHLQVEVREMKLQHEVMRAALWRQGLLPVPGGATTLPPSITQPSGE